MMDKPSKFKFTTTRPVAIIMIALGIVVFGLVSYKQLSWDLMPDVSYPTYTVRTAYPGAAPEEVENVVSRQLEEQLSLIKNLSSITSVSRPEQSDIILEFNWNTNLDRAAQEIREKIDQVYLVKEVERPMILRYDPSLDPVLRLGIHSEVPMLELRQIIEEEVARELEALPGVAAAKVKGGLEKEILIKVDENKLIATKIRFNDIATRLSQENVNLAGGSIKEGETEYIVRTLNEFKSVSEIGDIIIARTGGVSVRLRDIAEVRYSHKERTVITRIDKRESIEVDIYKEADANIVDVCERVKKRLLGTVEQREFVRKLKAGKLNLKGNPRQRAFKTKAMTNFIMHRLPENTEIKTLTDQSVFIENSINEVKSTAIIGGILAVIILYLFLQNFLTTFIVAVSIPLSIISTFAPLKLFDVNLNIMSLGGLALGIGMLVDSSIVVMESIFRCREEGDSLKDSAVRGVTEVGGAVIASTLTTIAVFFPIVFVEGIAGQIFGDLSLAVVFSLLASLLVSLFFIPMLASRDFEIKGESDHTKKFSFRFTKEQSAGNFFRIPLEIARNQGIILLNLIVVLLVWFFSFIVVLFNPFLVILRNRRPEDYFGFEKFLLDFDKKYFVKRVIWDDYMKMIPFMKLMESQAKRNGLARKLLVYPYFVFRFIIQSFVFNITRMKWFFITFFIVFLKGLAVFAAVAVVPLIKIAVKLFGRLINWINRVYPTVLRKCLDNDSKVLITVGVLFIISVFLILPTLGSELIPEVHQGTIFVNVTYPVGTSVEKTDQNLQNLLQKIKKIGKVSGVSYFAGTTKDELSEDEIGEHIGKITVNVDKTGNIKSSEEEVISDIREIMSSETDMDYNVSRPVLFSVKPPIEVVVKGYNLEVLRSTSRTVFEKISDIEGLKDVQTTIKPGFPELVIEFNRMKLAHYNMNASTVATLIKNKIEGFVATKYKEKDIRIDVRVYLKDEQRQRAENIKNLIINPGQTVPIKLSSVAEIKVLSGPNEIRRVNQERSAIITANISDIDLNEGVNRIFNVLSDFPMPPGMEFDISGQNKEMETSKNSMILAIALAIFLVYIVMASQFESFLHPFLILFTIPMALIGVVLVLFALQIPLGITVYIGIITLVGIVVNNAIVLIDYINILRQRGIEKTKAIMDAGLVRLRPILITTLTTVLGLLPMALGLGEGAEIRTPMAITVIAGLISATFLTLVLIPVVYKKFSK